MAWAVAAFLKPKSLLAAENLCLRQQLLVLQRRNSHPRLADTDRRFWILASRWFPVWRDVLLIVQPETVLRWPRRGWRPIGAGARGAAERAVAARFRQS